MNESQPPAEGAAEDIENLYLPPDPDFAKGCAYVNLAAALADIQRQAGISTMDMLHVVSHWQTAMLRQQAEGV